MQRRAYTPRDYQQRATRHVLEVGRSQLWMDMGLGKTVSTLTALDTMFLSGMESRPALAIAPLRVAKNTWPAEARKWAHLRDIVVSPVCGTEAERIAALRRDASLYTINYDNVQWLVDQLGDRWPFATVIADEATRLKGFRLRQGARRAQALARVAHKAVRWWINLTGTPAPNGLQDLWGQAWFVDAGKRLGRTHDAFKQRWFRPSYDGYGLEPLPFAKEQIEDRLRDVTLTLRAADYLTLPPLIRNTVRVDLPSKARVLYRQMEREMFLQIGGAEIEAFNAASRTMKCLQLANGAVYETPDQQALEEPTTCTPKWHGVHDAKIDALESVITEAAGAPVLVAYQFKSDLARLLKAFPKARFLDDAQQTEDDWNAGKIPILLAHPKSAGHGLNLQDGGNIIAFFGHWWDLELHDQIIERIGQARQAQAGHNRPVFVHYIVAADTVDELVLARIETKREVQDLLKEAMRVAA